MEPASRSMTIDPVAMRKALRIRMTTSAALMPLFLVRSLAANRR
jgi:hypothetical protein